MNERKFDELAKRLAIGSTRRSLLASLVGGVTALTASRAGGALSKEVVKVDICHFPPGNAEQVHRISVPLASAEAHIAHGDWNYHGCCRDSDCDVAPLCEPVFCSNGQCIVPICGAEEQCCHGECIPDDHQCCDAGHSCVPPTNCCDDGCCVIGGG